MPARLQPVNDIPSAFANVLKRLDRIEDTLSQRSLPPGYVVNIVDGSVVVTRQSDGATATLVFA